MKNHIKVLLDTLILLALLLVFAVLLTGGFTLDLYGLHISARHLNNPVVFLLLLLSTRYLIFGVPEFIKRQSSITWPRDYGIRGVVYFVLSVVCVKSFVSFIVIYHFNHNAVELRNPFIREMIFF